MNIRRLYSGAVGFRKELDSLLRWNAREDPHVANLAQEIIDQVRKEGDSSVLNLCRKYDKVYSETVLDLAIDQSELRSAFEEIPEKDSDALVQAANRIEKYHRAQKQGDFQITDDSGNNIGQIVTALDRVGVYVPGGQAAYPSSVLMTVIPATVAGVSEIAVAVPTPQGQRNSHVLAALHITGVREVYSIGGAQAVAAMAYGTETIRKVDKIGGPGGAIVAAAKRLVYGPVGIDMIAGPSEVLIIADPTANPDWVALDLFSQAEHGENSQSILLCPDENFLRLVEESMERHIDSLSRKNIIVKSLETRGAFVLTKDLEEAVAISNIIAPEHLQLAVAKPRKLMQQVRHAGAIFLGVKTPEVLGDYSAGPSHVLPTFGTARYSSPLGVYDFQKRSSVIECVPEGLNEVASIAAVIADMEGLTAHASAARARIKD